MVLLESESIQMGSEMKPFDLPNVDGDNFSNTDIKHDVAVVAFICNHCPYVVRIIKDFSALAKKHADKVQFVTISANDPDYREEDSFDNMKIFAKDHEFSFPYLFDEDQSVAKAYGAVCTPDIFVYRKIDGKFQLAYHARFDDLDKALTELSSDEKISFEQLPSAGCSIKWK